MIYAFKHSAIITSLHFGAFALKWTEIKQPKVYSFELDAIGLVRVYKSETL